MIQNLLKIIKNEQFRKLIIYGFGQLFNLVTPLLVAPYIIFICGEENFGKTAVGMAVAFFLIVFVDYGSDLVGVREVAINRDNPQKLQEIFVSTYTVKAAILTVIILISTLLFWIIPFFSSEKTMFIFGLSIVIGQFINPTWFLQGIENVQWITISNIISKLIYLAGIFLFIHKPGDYIFINFLWGFGMIVSNLMIVFLIFKKHSFRFYLVSPKEIFGLAKRDFSMFSSQFFVSLQLYTPILLISYFGNNLMAGQYKIVEQIIVIFKTFIFLFFNYVFPRICYLLETDVRKGIRNWKIYNGLNFLFVVSGMTFFYFFSYDVVSYFNPTNRYVLSKLLNVAVWIPVLLAISIPLKQLVLGWNHKRFYVLLTSIMVVVNLLAIIIILPFYKIYGVFYTLIGTDIIVILFYLIFIRKDLFRKFL